MAAWGERHSPADARRVGPDQAVELVLSSPVAMRELLMQMAARIDDGTLDDNRVIEALSAAHTSVVRVIMRGATGNGGRGGHRR